MDVELLGSFRTRTADDGSLEVWARGWRLESQLYALIPIGLALMFLMAPMGLAMRVGGAVVMLGATLFAFRMTKPGLLFTPEAVSIVSVVRTQTFPWAEVQGFMGERRHDEARIMLILNDDRRLSLPGTLDPSELDPYGDEGEMLSAADQLNRLRERAVADDLPKPAVPAVTAAAALDGAARTSKEFRRERKEVRAALKAVKLPSEKPAKLPKPSKLPKPAKVASPEPEPDAETPDDVVRPRRRLLRRALSEPAPELTPVTIAPEPAPEPPRRREVAPPPDLPSYLPKPTYIPQEEYAQMLRDQKAAEKAAAAAAAELRQLADPEEIDELAAKDEFSDWAS